MTRTSRILASTRHFAVTWGLPEDFGGMTSVVLRRSAGFADTGAPVTVLTFDDRLDTPVAVAALRDRGVLAPGVDVLHLWDWLASTPLLPAPGTDDLPFSPIESGADEDGRVVETELAGVVRRRERRAEDGTLLQVDRYRPDGTLLASDLRDVDERGRLGGRSVIVCDTDGTPVRGFTSVWGLYRHWLDRVTDKQRSMLIVDSKTAARFVRGYHRKHVATVHVVHSSHRAGDGEPGQPLKQSRREVLEKAEEFDAVVVLTERQRLDLAADLGPAANIAVVPNAGSLDAVLRAPLARSTDRGVVLASLTPRKRVHDAVAAAALANAPLDVYGEGPERHTLQQQILRLGSETQLRGHRADASLAFGEASFSLLTSTAEGAPLVLLESLAAGCIPIAYDIRYGPRDMIRNGVDGFVVPPGDIEAMAARIRELAEMSEKRRQRMRRAARRSASRFRQASVTEQWGELFGDIARRRWPTPPSATFGARARRGARRLLRRLRPA
jgi:poly(glycerol-phosphate) alpha-glucosyltransferase